MKKAKILFNLGGPDKLENVKPFLFNLFNDPAIINLPSFLAESSEPADFAAGLQVLRPEQMQRMIWDLTRFEVVWDIGVNNNGEIPFFLDDVIGFRAMAGGIDGENVIFPTHTPTPIKLLAMAAYAEESAGYVVENDFSLPPSQRTLFSNIDPAETDEDRIGEEIAYLHMRIYGLPLESNNADVDDAYSLWQQAEQVFNTESAWKTLLAAMFQSPDVILY